ncbi:MAG TPA: diguanylate cyclase [Anaeromyxobacter sp.]|nr:diguanylate cyclase [Anaeromyxobacter sp.]
MFRYVRRSIGRKLMLALGLPSLLFSLVGVLWLRHETRLVAPGLEGVYRTAIAALLLFSLAMAVTYVVVVRIFVRNPLKRLVAAMHRARQGDFLHRVPVVGDDEFGRLAAAYNDTLAAVTDLHARRIEDAAELEALERQLAVRAEAEKRAREMSFLVDLGRTLASTLDLDALLVALAERLTAGQRVEAVRVYLADEATGDLVLRAAQGDPGATIGSRIRPGEPVPGFRAVPLALGEDAGGLLALRKPGGAPPDADEELLVDSIAAQVGLAVANARLHQKMVRLSERDALTGAHNRRSLFARLDLELERSARFEHAMAVALVDVDRFRQYNDAFGHAAGDQILRDVAGILARAVRKVDLVARYGGEEFAVMLARADRDAALAAAEALRAAVEAANVPHGASEAGRVTISIGIGVFPEDGRDLGALIDAADAALYAAKRAGRNAVRAHESGMRTHPGRRRDVKVTADAEAGGT